MRRCCSVTAEVEQPVSGVCLHRPRVAGAGHGHGSVQFSSPVAKEVWDRADAHFMENYGKFDLGLRFVLTILTLCDRLHDHEHRQE